MYQHPGDLPAAPAVSGPVRSGASVVAILCAVGSFVMSARHHAAIGFILALVAIVAGLLGGIRALSPRVSGGILSMLAIALGVIALVVALLAAVF
jgi:hypothetical protein